MDCQTIEHWVLFEDGEKSLNESRQMREHLSTCSRCISRHRQALDWIEQWSAPAGELTADVAAQSILARMDERAEPSVARGFSRRWWATWDEWLSPPPPVVADAPVGGFSIFTLTSYERLRVRQIEALPAASLTGEGLLQAFPGAEISELRLQIR